MGRRRGAVNVLLLFLMMGLTAVAGALLAMTVRSLTAVCSYENGLCAVYAAESGAQYGLSLLEREGVPQNQVIEFSEEGRTCHVEFRGCDEGGGVLISRGTHVASGAERFIRLEYELRPGETGYAVIVNKIGASPWKAR